MRVESSRIYTKLRAFSSLVSFFRVCVKRIFIFAEIRSYKWHVVTVLVCHQTLMCLFYQVFMRARGRRLGVPSESPPPRIELRRFASFLAWVCFLSHCWCCCWCRRCGCRCFCCWWCCRWWCCCYISLFTITQALVYFFFIAPC